MSKLAQNGLSIMSKTMTNKYNPMNQTNYSKNATANRFLPLNPNKKMNKTGFSETKYKSQNKKSFNNTNADFKQRNNNNLLSENASELSGDSLKDEFQGAKNRREFINEANKIMRERMKNKGNTINSKSKFKSVVLMDTKEICLKNYLIGLLKDKRTELNEKERNISKAMKDSQTKLDKDCSEFLKYVEDRKKELKREDEEFIIHKQLHENAENDYRKETLENKKVCEDLERTIKLICLLKSYGSFVYKVLGQDFWFEDIPEVDPRKRNYEEVGSIILNKYKNLNEEKKQNIVNDESLLILKFKEFEDRVLKILGNKELVDKENKNIEYSYNNELEELRKRERDMKYEEQRMLREKQELIYAIDRLIPQKDNELDLCLNYIAELGVATGQIAPKPTKSGKKNISDYLAFTQETLENLSQREKEINDFIDQIQQLELTGDPKIFKEISGQRKNDNKREKQALLKKKQEQIELEKSKKAVERAQRVIIKGRKVPKDYIISKQKVKKTTDNKVSGKDDYDMLYYYDE